MVSDRRATDARGLAMSGSSEAAAAYNRAIDHLLRFQVEVVDEAAASIRADPGFVMGHVLSADLALMSTDGGDVDAAAASLAALHEAVDEATLLPRERRHLAATGRWVAGDLAGAGEALDAVALHDPTDVLALAVGHQIDFLTGDAVNLRDRIGRVLPDWDRDDSAYGFLQGMHAFGLEECNLYDLAREAGEAALGAHADDVWALHAVVHTCEMQGRVAEGLRFMADREGDWADGNFLNVHNWWHRALYLLEADDVAGALAIYDRVLHHAGSEDVAMELLDATSLLWRLLLESRPVGGRWGPLADAWARCLVPGHYPFNDMHAVMSFVGAERLDQARDLVADLEQVAMGDDGATTGPMMTATVGLPVCRAVLAYAEGADDAVVDDLLPIRRRVNRFGGSHAQRDVVARLLLDAALRAGRTELAAALAGERLTVREDSPYNWLKRAQVLRLRGAGAAAATAEEHAEALVDDIRSAAGLPTV